LVARRSLTTTDRALFVSVAGQSLPYNTVRRIFLHLLDRTDLRGAYSGRDPRIHDLRHSSGTPIIPATGGELLHFRGDHGSAGASLAE
jgi:hypothetical protein